MKHRLKIKILFRKKIRLEVYSIVQLQRSSKPFKHFAAEYLHTIEINSWIRTIFKFTFKQIPNFDINISSCNMPNDCIDQYHQIDIDTQYYLRSLQLKLYQF